MKHNREELIERLKEIAAEEVPKDRHKGAMCYSIAPPPEKKSKCDRCNKEIIFNDWNENEIPDMVNEMASLGYDAKVEVLCRECFEKVKEELYPGVVCDKFVDNEHPIWLPTLDRNYLFYFRTDSNEPYHRVLANTKFNYIPVLTFFRGEKSYQHHGADYFLTEKISIIEFMTGLKIDE